MADVGSILSGAAGLGSAIMNPFMQMEQNRWNAHQMRLQNQWNIEQWQRENAYNTPLAQMARLQAAGINPALAFSQGGLMNEAAASPAMQASQGRAPQLDPMAFSQINLSAAQADDLRASAALKRSQTTYQQYINQVEEQLQHVPVGTVSTTDSNGETTVEIKYGNYRVEFAKRDLHALGLDIQQMNVELSDMYYNLAVLTGSDIIFGTSGDTLPSSLPGYEDARAALRGSQKVQDLSSQMYQLSYEAAQAEKAGREAYAEWLKEHKDDPVVKVMLAIQGFLQTFGITLPSFGGSSAGSSSVRTARGGRSYSSANSWFFRPN